MSATAVTGGQQRRGPGRPRLPQPNYRVECMVPKAVWDELVRQEKLGQGYRTRVAANVLSNWAKESAATTVRYYQQH